MSTIPLNKLYVTSHNSEVHRRIGSNTMMISQGYNQVHYSIALCNLDPQYHFEC